MGPLLVGPGLAGARVTLTRAAFPPSKSLTRVSHWLQLISGSGPYLGVKPDAASATVPPWHGQDWRPFRRCRQAVQLKPTGWPARTQSAVIHTHAALGKTRRRHSLTLPRFHAPHRTAIAAPAPVPVQCRTPGRRPESYIWLRRHEAIRDPLADSGAEVAWERCRPVRKFLPRPAAVRAAAPAGLPCAVARCCSNTGYPALPRARSTTRQLSAPSCRSNCATWGFALPFRYGRRLSPCLSRSVHLSPRCPFAARPPRLVLQQYQVRCFCCVLRVAPGTPLPRAHLSLPLHCPAPPRGWV